MANLGITIWTPIDNESSWMNPATGSVDTYDGWWYENSYGESVNAVDLGEVVPVFWNGQQWIEV